MSRRVLAMPKTDSPIDNLVHRIRDYLYFPDPSALYVLLGAVAANLIDGDPVWLMLVGPPGCGKTELLNSLLGVGGVHESAHISNESAFLSATPKHEVTDDATGGILRQVGKHGAVVINDFTTILGLRKDNLDAVLNVIREVYSGRWTRNVGSEGGKQLHWDGKATMLAGCTGAIDEHHSANASLGERWLYFRFGEQDNYEKTRRALINSARGNWRDDLRLLMRSFFEGLDLRFGKLEKRREFTDAEIVRVIAIAGVAARCRSAVTRDGYSKEITTARETESETRIATALGQLLVGLDMIGIRRNERYKLIARVAMDSMPKLRRIAIEMAQQPEGATFREMAKAMGCSVSTAQRTVEDLAVHGVLEKHRKVHVTRVKPTDWMWREWRRGWGQP